mmetsp:Transcript_6512/g.16802  ORF Transcript_6512/g.16802 Transcript_6512/m.16802 type:complete len:369 (-) Transcript_6512:186-1292(-)
MWRFLSEFFRCVFISFIVTHHPSSCLGFLSFLSGVLLWFRVLGWWRPDVHPGLLVVDEVVQGDHRPHERGQVHRHHHVVRLHRKGLVHLVNVQVRHEIKGLLQVVHDFVVDRQLSVNDHLHVALDIFQVVPEVAESGQPVRDLRRQGADRRVLDIPQEVLDPNLFSLVRTHFRGHVDEDLLRPLGPVLLHLVHRAVRLDRDPVVLGLHVHHHQQGLLAVLGHELVDLQVGVANSGPRAVPADHDFPCVDLSEHGVHVLVIGVVHEPDAAVALVLLEGDRIGVGHVHDALLHLAEQHPDHPLPRVLRYAVVVVDHRQQHQRVHDHLIHLHLLTPLRDLSLKPVPRRPQGTSFSPPRAACLCRRSSATLR